MPLPYTYTLRAISCRWVLLLFVAAATEAFRCASCRSCFAQGASEAEAEALLCVSNLLAGCGWTTSLGYAPWFLGCRIVAECHLESRHGRDFFQVSVPPLCTVAFFWSCAQWWLGCGVKTCGARSGIESALCACRQGMFAVACCVTCVLASVVRVPLCCIECACDLSASELMSSLFQSQTESLSSVRSTG